MGHEGIRPDNIPELMNKMRTLSAINAEIIGRALGAMHSEVVKDEGCAFASNLILHTAANVFASTLTFVVSHRHNDEENKTNEKILGEINEKLNEFIGNAMKQYGSRDGAVILSVEIGEKKKEPS